MKKFSKILFLVVLGLILFTQATLAFDVNSTGLPDAAKNAGFDTSNADKNHVIILAGNIIQVAIGILGFVLMIFIVYAGILYMTAGDDKEAVKKARDYITNGIIGMIVVAAAYAISTYVMSAITTVITP